jgi:hypothetical protein
MLQCRIAAQNALNRFGIAPMKAARSGKFAFVHGMEWL